MIQQHPLLPSQRFMTTQIFQEIAQTVCLTNSFTHGISFYLSQKVAQCIFSFPPFAFLLSLPSSLVHKISGNNENIFRKISWIAPVTGIALGTLSAYKLYALSTNFLIQGAICGIHSRALLFFSYLPASAEALGFISLNSIVKDLFLNPTRFNTLGKQKLNSISSYSETVASVAFLVSSIALTLLLKNPILANSVAYVITSITKTAVMRFLGEIALIRKTHVLG